VVLTSNNTRELSEALKRRALYLFIDYPSMESELNIVKMRVPNIAPTIAKQCVEVVQRLRQLDLKKSPSVAETVDWAKALVAINAKHLDEKTLNDTLTVILKHESDIQRARRALNGGGNNNRVRDREIGVR
jgi:MoxR-like ATPase